MSRLPILLAFALVGCKIHVYEQGNGHGHGDPTTGVGDVDAGVECSSGDDGGCNQGYEPDSGIYVTNDAGWGNYPPDAGCGNYPPDGGWSTFPLDAAGGFVDGAIITLDAAHP